MNVRASLPLALVFTTLALAPACGGGAAPKPNAPPSATAPPAATETPVRAAPTMTLAPLDVDFVAQQPLYNLTVAKYVRCASSVHMGQSNESITDNRQL
jgi:hypothetical protein